jgi:TRAP-type C4-dicarboxylate transport system permease small subunit
MRVYDAILDGLALIAGIVFGLMFAVIVYDVTTRALGVLVIDWVEAVCEYAILYATALAAPWLLREKGHVCIEFVRSMASPRVRAVMERLVYLTGLAMSLIVVVYSIPVIERSWDELDIRAFEMPRWLLYVPLTVGFALMAVGFARYLFGKGTLYAPVQAGDEGF